MPIAMRAQRIWATQRESVLWFVVVGMAVAATVWLGYETYRFFVQPKQIGPFAIAPGAIDLGTFHDVVTTWFSGASVFAGDTAVHVVYPPASMLLIWPLYGWERTETVVAVWWATLIPLLLWLVRISIRETGARTRPERFFAALLPLSIYGTGAIVGNGQMTLHVLVFLVGGLLLLRDRTGNRGRDLTGALLILLALAKPTISAPFFWIVLFAVGRLRPAVVVCAAYAALTLAAVPYQGGGTIELLQRIAGTAANLSQRAGESNLHSLLSWLGRPEWIAPASIAALLLFGLWVWQNRRSDLWLLMGAAAIVARFWSYHRWYDDVVLLLPMITLYRLACGAGSAGNPGRVAGVLLVLTLLSLIAPGGRYLLPAPWDAIWGYLQATVWIIDLVFLLAMTRRARRQLPGAPEVTQASLAVEPPSPSSANGVIVKRVMP